MKHVAKIFLSLLLLTFMAAAQEQAPSADKVPVYNVAEQQTFTGTIQEVKDYQCPVSGTIGSHITIRGAGQTVEIHLAPAKFIKDYEIVLKPGDVVTVTGVKFEFAGGPAMMAKTVVAGKSRFTFRDNNGRPLW